MTRARLLLVRSLLTAACSWLALQTWRGFTDDGAAFSRLLLVGVVIVALVGWGIRAVAPRFAALAPVVQVALIAWWFISEGSLAAERGESSLAASWRTLVTGIDTARTQVTPVPAIYPEFLSVLVLAAMALVIVLDLLACGFDQPALMGIPLLLIVAIAASIYLLPRSAVLLMLAAALWLAVVALTEMIATAQPGGDTAHGLARGWGATATIVGVSAAVALVVPQVVPTRATLGPGSEGGGAAQGTRLTNPMLNLKRDLTLGPDIDLVTVQTEDDASYLRLSVLDQFDASVWKPSSRSLSEDNALSSRLPGAEGLTARVATSSSRWRIEVSRQFETSWLPLPFPTTAITSIPGQWRVDPSTLDVTSADERTAAGFSYSLDALRVTPTKEQLQQAPYLTGPMVERMTALPDGLPPAFLATAKRVTRGSKSDYERAVKLQRWFRDDGGFTYSTAASPGTGIATLANFITIDRVGYCEQFATAMATLARELRIPSRVAVGFLHPDVVGGDQVFSTRDMHAWPELFFAGVGWVRFEPTPSGRAAEVPAYTRGRLRVPVTGPGQPSTTVKPTPNPTPLPLPDRGTTDPTKTGSGSAPWWWSAAALLLSLALAPRLVRTLRRRRRLAATDADALAAGLWDELRDSTLDAGLIWTEGRSPRVVERDLVASVAPPDVASRDALRHVVRFVEERRYDRPVEVSARVRTAIVEDLQTWEETVARTEGRGRDGWWPASVLSFRRRRHH